MKRRLIMDTVPLWEKAPVSGEHDPEDPFEPYLKTYFLENAPACVLICPGGGYEFVSEDIEGDAAAKKFNEMGISAAYLNYRVFPYTQPDQISDAKRAMRYLRYNAEKFGYPKDKIGIMGFSAGGHLAGCTAVHFEEEENPKDDIDRESSRPDFQILCYPVITTDMSFAHAGSIIALLGKQLENDELLDYYSLEKQVTADTPQAFIWHTACDSEVPVKNSLEYAKSLAAHKIPVELHIYPFAQHGLAFGKFNHTEKWVCDLECWLKDIILTDEAAQ